MTSTFNQIGLDQDSQFITAFQSDTCIKCFKRPNFAVNSVAEELEHALQTIPGKTNIADDILIFAENTKQHVEILTQVLKQCESKESPLI